MDKSSYIDIKVENVRKACEKAKISENAQRTKMLEEVIHNRMTKRFFPSKTREDAIKYLKGNKDMFGYSYYQTIMATSGLEDFANRMLKMCDKAEGGVIFMSDYHFSCLSEFMEVE